MNNFKNFASTVVLLILLGVKSHSSFAEDKKETDKKQQQPPAPMSKATKEVICAPSSLMFKILLGDDFKEIPQWFGTQNNASDKHVLIVNHQSTSWTFLQFNNQDACILGSGDNFAFSPELMNKSEKPKQQRWRSPSLSAHLFN
jgi:hypothetical protein